MLSLFSVTAYQNHYDKQLDARYQTLTSLVKPCLVTPIVCNMDKIPTTQYSLVSDAASSSASSCSSSPSLLSSSCASSPKHQKHERQHHFQNCLHKTTFDTSTEIYDLVEPESSVPLKSRVQKNSITNTSSKSESFLLRFQFSEQNNFLPSRSSSSKTFHKIVEQAVACSHVSSNFLEISTKSDNSIDQTTTRSNATHVLIAEDDHSSTSGINAQSRITSTPSKNNPHKMSPNLVKVKVPKISTLSDSNVKGEEYMTIEGYTPPDELSLFSSSSFSSPASSSCHNPSKKDKKLDEKKSPDWSPFENFSDLHGLSDYYSPAPSGLDFNKEKPLRNDSHQVTDDVADGTCAICLSDILEQALLGELTVCRHKFCFECIMTWADRTNYCPLCKQKFTCISQQKWTTDLPKNRKEISLIEVEDKVLHIADDDNVPTEGARRSLEDYICQVCRDGNQEEVLLLCDGCDEAYHTFCVGRTDIPEGQWFCHACAPLATEAESSTRASRRSSHQPSNPRNSSCSQTCESNTSSLVRRTSQRRATCDQTRATSRRQRPCTRQHLATISALSQQRFSTRRPITRSISQRVQEARETLSNLESMEIVEPQTIRTRENCRNSRRLACSEGPVEQRCSDLEQRIRQRWSLNNNLATRSSCREHEETTRTRSFSTLVIPPLRQELRDDLLNDITQIASQPSMPCDSIQNICGQQPHNEPPNGDLKNLVNSSPSTPFASHCSGAGNHNIQVNEPSRSKPTVHIPSRKLKALKRTLDESFLGESNHEIPLPLPDSSHSTSSQQPTTVQKELELSETQQTEQCHSSSSIKKRRTTSITPRFHLRKRVKQRRKRFVDYSSTDFDSSET